MESRWYHARFLSSLKIHFYCGSERTFFDGWLINGVNLPADQSRIFAPPRQGRRPWKEVRIVRDVEL